MYTCSKGILIQSGTNLQVCTQQTGIGVDKISYINNCKLKLVTNSICNFTLDLMNDESSLTETTTSEFAIATKPPEN